MSIIIHIAGKQKSLNEIVNAAIPKDVSYKTVVDVKKRSYTEVLEESDTKYKTERPSNMQTNTTFSIIKGPLADCTHYAYTCNIVICLWFVVEGESEA